MSAAPFKEQVIPCPYIGSGEASERLLEVAAMKYRTVSASAERLQFARAYRPLWSVIVGIILLPILIGIPFLLIKSTETWSAAIEEDHRKLQVRVTGRILPFVLVQLTDALAAGPSAVPASGSPRPTADLGVIDMVSTPPGVVESHLGIGTPLAAPSVASSLIDPDAAGVLDSQGEVLAPPVPVLHEAFGPRTSAGTPRFNRERADVPQFASPGVERATPALTSSGVNGADHTVLRGSMTRQSPSAPVVPEVLVAKFDTGEKITLGPALLVGRAPDAGDEFGSAELLAIDDEAMSVSKTHLLVRFQDGKPEVMDLGSTNGTQIVASDGKLTRLVARRAVAVAPGYTVKFGDRSFVLATADGGHADG